MVAHPQISLVDATNISLIFFEAIKHSVMHSKCIMEKEAFDFSFSFEHVGKVRK